MADEGQNSAVVDYAPARAFLQHLAPTARVAIAYHGDADGTGSCAVAVHWVRATGRTLACALAPGKGEDLYGEGFANRIVETKPNCLLVLDQGSRPRPIVPGLPTLVVDHHDRPEEGVPVDVYVSGLDEEPTPTAALMTRFYAATEDPEGLDDPIGVALAYENVLGILQL